MYPYLPLFSFFFSSMLTAVRLLTSTVWPSHRFCKGDRSEPPPTHTHTPPLYKEQRMCQSQRQVSDRWNAGSEGTQGAEEDPVYPLKLDAEQLSHFSALAHLHLIHTCTHTNLYKLINCTFLHSWHGLNTAIQDSLVELCIDKCQGV